ncbi:MAG: hypothetical protein JNK15_06305 [Planctomycetes bacterium]|nr:hypothetical protein [Planctomycetota bacterium]
MTATAPLTAPSLQQLAPHVVPKVKDGDLAKAQMGLLAVGAVLVGAAWATGGKSFAWSYLVGYMGVLGICLGALAFVMIQHITRAGWSVVVRRVAENIAAALPLMLLLWIPILVNFDELFHHWAHANVDEVTHAAIPATDPSYDAVLAGKEAWLNKGFFLARVGIYFAIWIGLAFVFRNGSVKQDETGNPAINLKLSRIAAPGLLLFALSTTFASFDWIMSLDPHWFSTIFGIAYFAGGYMAFFAVLILLTRWLGTQGYLKDAVSTEHYHDLGKLMFAFMVFWTYANFSQYMLIWYANLPEETAWFTHRKHGGWAAVGQILILGHFFIPFAFLMSRHVKRNPVALAVGAIFLLVIHCIDMQFLILPNNSHAPADAGAAADHHVEGIGAYLSHLHWADFGCFVGVLALVLGFVLWNVRRANLLPVRDPRLAESLHFQNI